MRRFIALALLLNLLCGIVTGCYDARETDDLSYAIAIGLDKGKTNSLRMTFQLAIPKNIGGSTGGGGGGGGGGEESFTIVTVEAPTIYSAINMTNTFVSRQVILSHAKAIVFSSELAREGIDKYMNALERSREFRPNTYVLVSRDSAEDYIKNVKPKIETNPAKYYELAFKGYNFTSFSADTRFYNFYNQLKSKGIQPCAILAGVSKFNSPEEFNLKGSTYKEKGRDIPFEGDFKAGDVTKSAVLKSEIMGLAVFNGGKMVGELDGAQTTSHLMITGDFKYAFATLPDPKEKKEFVILNVKQSRKPIHRVGLVDGKPHIYVKVRLEADILSIQSGENYEDVNKIKELEDEAEGFIKASLERYLEKSRDELKSDICGFGDHFRATFLTWKEWEEFDWLSKYKDASFDVEVDFKIRRSGLMIYTSPPASPKEDGEE